MATDVEKGASHLDSGMRPPIQLTPEQYERLFVQPGGIAPAVPLSQKFGNPTPLGMVCYLLCLTPTVCYYMQWGKSNTASLTTMVGPYYFIGGPGMFITGVMEWVSLERSVTSP
jgi:uncharacterized protein